MRNRFLLGLAAMALAWLSGCGEPAAQATTTQSTTPQPVVLHPGEKLRVVATTTIISDAVMRVGGDRIALTTLMGIGVDPHSYIPVSGDSAAIHDAHVLFANGAGLEESLRKLLDGAGGSAVRVQLSDGLELRAASSSGEEQAGSGAAAQAEMDPHVWFDARNVIAWVTHIQQVLSALDPENAPEYEADAEAYIQELEALDAWILGQVAAIPTDRRLLVANHPVFGYFADRYGFVQQGSVYPISPSAEPSAREIAALEDTVRHAGVGAVFVESTVDPKLALQVAQDTGVNLVPLFTDSLGGSGSGAESYVDMMHFDVMAIVQALE